MSFPPKCTPEIIECAVREILLRKPDALIVPKMIAFELGCSTEAVCRRLRNNPELIRALGIVMYRNAKALRRAKHIEQLKELAEALADGKYLTIAAICNHVGISTFPLYEIFTSMPHLHRRLVRHTLRARDRRRLA